MIQADDVDQLLRSAADPVLSKSMSDYMRGHFYFYGVTAPVRKEICKAVTRESRKIPLDDLIQIVHGLWAFEARECQHSALDILIANKKRLRSGDLADVEYWLTHKSWWDTVDGLASHVVGSIVSRDLNLKMTLLSNWLDSDNIWLNRTCLIFQLKYKQQLDFQFLKKAVLKLKLKDEFFIQKAIGWSLRQHSRVDPAGILGFVNDTPLSNLARREGLKLIR